MMILSAIRYLLVFNLVYGYEIDVHYGQLEIKGVNECTFVNNGNRYTYIFNDTNFQMQNQLLFGFIEYSCNNNTINDVLLSKFECKECGLYCRYNEMFPRCRQRYLNRCIGFSLGLVGFLILKTILMYIWKKMVLWYNYFKYSKSDSKRIRLAKKMKDITPNFKEIKNEKLKPKHIEKIKNKREKFAMSVRPLAPEAPSKQRKIYPEIPNSQLINTGLIQTFIIIGLLIGVASPCDNTLYLSSNNQICTDSKCTHIPAQSFPIKSGQIICFQDTDKNFLKIHLSDVYYTVHYSHVYDTSEFAVKSASTYNCRFGSGCNSDVCKRHTKHEMFKEVSNRVQDYNCETKTSCKGWCAYGTACIFYHWWLEPTGSKARIYKFVERKWRALLSVEYQGISKHSLVFSTDIPSHNLDNVNVANITSLPLILNSFSGPDYFHDKFIMLDGTNYYGVKASEMNFPETNIIGDYQIPLEMNFPQSNIVGNYNSKTHIYNVKNVDCQVICTGAHCEAHESKLKRFRNSNNEHLLIDSDKVIRKSEHHIERIYPIRANFNLMIGKVDIDNLYAKPAACSFDEVFNFACLGCNKKPYVIFQPKNIQESGIILFTSNCTFSSNYLICSPRPFHLELETINSFCRIDVPSTNQTIYINTYIEYVGNLDSSKPELSLSESNLDIAKSLFANYDVFTISTFTICGFTLFTAIWPQIIRCLTYCFIKREAERFKDRINA